MHLGYRVYNPTGTTQYSFRIVGGSCLNLESLNKTLLWSRHSWTELFASFAIQQKFLIEDTLLTSFSCFGPTFLKVKRGLCFLKIS